MSLPKISIITPSFNSSNYIEECIQSVLNQKYPNIEHIIFDNCSTDGTIEILKKYPHLIWISEKDKGQSDAINKGFKLSTGDLVGWLNTDDYYLPDAFNTLFKYYNENPTHHIFYGERIRVDKNKNTIKHQIDHEFDFNILLYDYCYISSTSTFFKREIIDSHLINVNYRILMDAEFYLRLAKSGYKFKYLPYALAGFRIHENNVSRNNEHRRKLERYIIQSTFGSAPFRNQRLNSIYLYSKRPFYKLKRILIRFIERRLNYRFNAAKQS